MVDGGDGDAAVAEAVVDGRQRLPGPDLESGVVETDAGAGTGRAGPDGLERHVVVARSPREKRVTAVALGHVEAEHPGVEVDGPVEVVDL